MAKQTEPKMRHAIASYSLSIYELERHLADLETAQRTIIQSLLSLLNENQSNPEIDGGG